MTSIAFINILAALAGLHIILTWAGAVREGLRAYRGQSSPPPETGDSPPVSILVPAWNESQRIEACILALRQVAYPCFEVLILAGGADGTFSIAARAISGDERFRLLERGPEPKNVALSRGVQKAHFDILVLLDADNLVEPGWLRALVAPLMRGAAASVGESFPNLWTWVTVERQMWHILTYDIRHIPLIQGDRSVAVRREVLTRAGGLPARTFAREDWDLGVRIEALGEKIAFAKGARLVTDWPSSLSELWKLQLRWRRSHLTGLWEQRKFYTHHLASGFSQAYGYLLSIFIALCLPGSIAAAWLQSAARVPIFQVAVIFFAWLALRRASLAGEIAAFTRDLSWLRKAWTTVAVMLVEIPASIIALLTLRRQTAFYKGARHEVTPNV